MRLLLRYFVKLFEQNPRWLVRVLAAAGFGFALALYVVLKNMATISAEYVIATLIGVPAFMTAAGLLLATADTVRRQLRAGESVPAVLRLLFGAGIWSVLVWFVVFLIVGFPVAIWLGSMTWTRPAG